MDRGDAAVLSHIYSSNAPAYRELWAPIIHRESLALLKELPLQGAGRVLDVGAGVGMLLPEIQRHASRAWVAGVDRAEGMIALGPSRFARGVMDARFLSFRADTFDVVTMAFVLFHLEDPLPGLMEAARVLRPGGTIGSITWGGGPSYPALDIWNEELEAAGAAPADDRFAHHELVDAPAKLKDLLGRAGFDSSRAWARPFEHRQDLEEFISHRIAHGSSKRRLDSLDSSRRAACIERARERLTELTPDDFVDRAEVVLAVGRLSG